ncbi:GMC oxidoreductase [Mycena galopus ATCC 62051]|nr:GMC oxidoreductase [Mycena galopus ATCC 62051]
MGSSSSKIVSNPAHFATPVVDETSGIQPKKDSWKTYDYVIVGGGTAGCVLASRLSENPEFSVLLIEAGKSNKGNLLSRIPLAFTQLLPTAANWQYETIPQSEVNERVLSCDRGKILGGSSSINASLYQRCAPENFSDWVKAGAEGWDAVEMNRYFHKAEKYSPNPQFPQIDTTLHGSSGLSSTRYGPFALVCDSVIDAAVSVGIPRIPDMNAGNGPAGVSNFVGAVDVSGERSSAATAYLTSDVLCRPNLTVAVETMVSKVVLEQIDGAEPRATGVLAAQRDGGRIYAVAAKREVIVSTGSIVTPQLLMVSGIGPADELRNHKIPVVRDLPLVGKNLLDHYSGGSLIVRAKAGKTWDHILSPLGGIVALSKWLISGSGPMTSIAAPVGVFVHSESIVYVMHFLCHFAHTPSSVSPSKDSKAVDITAVPLGVAPDIEIFFAPMIVINNGFTKTPGKTGLTIGCVALSPASQGTISLKSSNIFDHPLIDPKYLFNKNDLGILIKATRLALRIARAEPIASSLELPEDSKDETTYFWPGDADPDTLTDQQITAWIRRNGQTAWHPTSTAKMGASAETSVVNSQLRVHGVAGLRVVDASVFPTSVSGHPCAVVIALAEKASDMIKAAQ